MRLNISIEKNARHPSQRGFKLWFRRIFKRWIYPYGSDIRVLRGVESHYEPFYDWMMQNVPDNHDSVWLVIDKLTVDGARQAVSMDGEIRFRRREDHLMFLLRFPLDLDSHCAII